MSELNGEINQVEQIGKALERATSDITGEIGSDPFRVFPDPKSAQRRADVKWEPTLSDEQEQKFRLDMGDIGPGRATDVGPAEVGFDNLGYVAVLEGGQPHKMIAQLQVVRNPGSVLLPSAIIQTASADRKVGEDEKTFTAKYLGCDVSEVAETELGVAEQILRNEIDFEPVSPEDTAMPIDKLYDEAEGSLMRPYQIGSLLNPHSQDPANVTPVKVTLVGVKRVYKEGSSTEYSQASNADKLKQAIGIFNHQQGIGFVTSATYQPSNVVSAHHVAEETGVNVQVLSYGTEALAAVKGVEPVQPPLHQLGGEAYKTAELLLERPDTGE